MEQPEGFHNGSINQYCKLFKTLYGLKQSGREWYKVMKAFFLKLGYIQSSADSCIYFRSIDGKRTIVGVYVDDILTTGNDIERFRSEMHREFGMDDGDELNWYLGIGIERHSDGSYEIQQNQYLKDKCKEYERYIDKNGYSNPLPTDFLHILERAETSKEIDTDFPYSETVGSLMYAMIGTRPDLAMALSVVCRFMQNPKKLHCDLVKPILRYVNYNSYSLIYKSHHSPELVGWVDASYANQEKFKSTTGYLFTFGNTAISWLSSRQPVVALSSCEAELIAANSVVQETIWIKQLLSDIGVNSSTISLMEDNEACIISITNEPNTSKYDSFISENKLKMVK
jgi:hypothetical protein